MDDYLGQASLRAAVLPSRAVYLIRAGSREGARRAIREACTRWAGATEPIIPVRSGGRVDPAMRQFVDFAKVDGAVNVDVGGDDAGSAAKNLALPLVDLQYIDRTGPVRCTCHPANLPQRSEPDTFVIASSPADLWEVVAAGDSTPAHVKEASDAGFRMRRPRTVDEIGRAQLSSTTALNATLEGFRERRARNLAPTPALIWVVRPNALLDCLWFWNVRALRAFAFENPPVLVIPGLLT